MYALLRRMHACTLLTATVDRQYSSLQATGVLLRWYIEQYEATETDKDLAMLMPGIRQAILWSVAAFGELSNQTISNCWRKTDILPPVWNAQLVNADEREKTRVAEANADLSSLLT